MEAPESWDVLVYFQQRLELVVLGTQFIEALPNHLQFAFHGNSSNESYDKI